MRHASQTSKPHEAWLADRAAGTAAAGNCRNFLLIGVSCPEHEPGSLSHLPAKRAFYSCQIDPFLFCLVAVAREKTSEHFLMRQRQPERTAEVPKGAFKGKLIDQLLEMVHKSAHLGRAPGRALRQCEACQPD